MQAEPLRVRIPRQTCPLALSVILLSVATADAQTTTRVSVSSAGQQGDALSYLPAISRDGTAVSFTSASTALVAGDTNGFRDVFVRDLPAGQTTRVSVSSTGQEADGHSGASALSADGRFVAFASTATNLVPGDTGGWNDVFLHDRQPHPQTGLPTTIRVSVSSAGVAGNGASHTPSISDDGRFVVFESAASNLVAGDTNGLWDVFVHDHTSGETKRVSVSSSGGQSNGDSRQAAISPDGRYVTFTSGATTIVPGVPAFITQIFVHDLQTGQTTLASVSSGGTPGNDDSLGPAISEDGRYVAFSSYAGNLDPADQTASEDVYVHDRTTGETQLVSLSSDGEQANAWCFWPEISSDGRYVAFVSDATNLVAGDTNGRRDVFLRDRTSGTTERSSVSSQGIEGDGTSGFFSGPALSADARFVAFQSAASNLVLGDTNGADDVFLRDRATGGPGTSFCSGDGSGTACPCGNPGSAGHGCANSSFASGAQLSASGSASVGSDSLVLTATGSVPSQPGLFFQGTQAVQGGSGAVFGDGLRCAGGSIVRLETRIADAGGSVSTTLELSAAGGVQPGDVRRYQWWYRDPSGSPCGSGFNLSNGVLVTWAP